MLSLFQNKEKKRQTFLATWGPLLEQAKHSLPEPLPALPKKDARFFIEAWNALYEQAGDQEKVGLAVLAYRVDIHRYAAGMLIASKADTRLAGIRILGYMRDESAWPILIHLAKKQDKYILPAVWQSLLLINSRRLSIELVELLSTRSDWPVESIADLTKKHLDIDWCTGIKRQPQNLSAQCAQQIAQFVTLFGSDQQK